MLSEEDQQRAMVNCDKVRKAFRVQALQVLPDPKSADNVSIRVGQGPWTTMHVESALVFVRNAFLRHRRKRKAALAQQRAAKLRIALDSIKQRFAALPAHEQDNLRDD